MNAEDSDITYTVLTSRIDVAKGFMLIDSEYKKAKKKLHAYAAHANISTNHHEQTARDHIQAIAHAAPVRTLTRLQPTRLQLVY